MKRCRWAENVPAIYEQYHDTQWGTPVYDDRELFEMLVLESFHTGLSWLIVLKKREDFRLAFDNFDAEKISEYDESKIQALLNNSKIIRNENKIRSTLANARAFLRIQKEFGSFCSYLWGFVNNQAQIQSVELTTSELSDQVSKDLKKRGFRFMGSITTQSYLQAVGVIWAHEEDCFRWEEYRWNTNQVLKDKKQ